MATQAQIDANRRNAKLSTGPRTSTGRARSAMNATKSGIYAKAEIIPGEDPAELDALKSQYYDSLQPAGHEIDLVDQAIRAGWQLRRLARAEADVWTRHYILDRENSQKKGLPENPHVLACAIERCEEFDRLYRFQAATARILNRSLETLLRLRKAGSLLDPDETNPTVGQVDNLRGGCEPPHCPPSETCPSEQKSPETNPIPAEPVPDPCAEAAKPAETDPISDPPPPAPAPRQTNGATRYRINDKTGKLELRPDYLKSLGQ
jgi:hypothetical protein